MITHAQILSALAKWTRQPFSYGVADCCIFTIFMVKELANKDYSTAFCWSTEQEAETIIRSKGGLLGVIKSVLGEPSLNIPDGSPCLVKIPNTNPLMGVKLGENVVCLTHNGLARVASKYTVAGWDICQR